MIRSATDEKWLLKLLQISSILSHFLLLPKWHKKEFADLRQQRDYYHGIKDTENFKKYRNKLTSSIRTSKANYFSEAIKSGNNVGELWKHLKDINSASKCHIKCITIDGKKCDNIEDICNNFNNHLSSVAERIIKNSNLNASTENCSYLQYLLIYKVGLL
jgi:hypothetical protein